MSALALLHSQHAGARLSCVLGPPFERGVMWSIVIDPRLPQ